MANFVERLKRACEVHRSLLCVGLDPDPERMPVADPFPFNRAIIDATADLVCCYKPNLAFYEALGLKGLEALQRTVEHIRQTAPEIVIIGDGKRGDTGNTARMYAKAFFEVWGLDAATVNAYGGHDALEPFLRFRDRGVLVWCRSSNPGAADLQDLELADGKEGTAFYLRIAMKAREWNVAGNVGLVVGATFPQELKTVRALCPEMAILIPGVGTQGGDLEEAVRSGTDGRGRLAIINVSRQVLYASPGKDFPHAARREALTLRERINRVLEREGKGWS